jgi:hypothetical protein
MGILRLSTAVSSVSVFWNMLLSHAGLRAQGLLSRDTCGLRNKCDLHRVLPLSHIPSPFLWGWGEGTWVQTQGFILAKQALYHLSHIFSSFFSGYLGDGVSRAVCPGWP